MRYSIVIVFLAITSVIYSQGYSPTYTFKAGKDYAYEVERKQQMQMNSKGYHSALSQIENYSIILELKEKTKEHISLLMRFKSYRQVQNNDSLINPDDFELNALDTLIRKNILNRTYFVNIDKYGNVLSVTPPKFTFKWYEMDSLHFEALLEFSDKANITNLLNEVLVVYPRNPIVGKDTWNNVQYFDAGVPTIIYKNNQITGARNKLISVAETATIVVDDQQLSSMENKNEEVLLSGNGGGSILIEKKSFLLISKEISYKMKGSISVAQGTMEITNKLQTVVRQL